MAISTAVYQDQFIREVKDYVNKVVDARTAAPKEPAYPTWMLNQHPAFTSPLSTLRDLWGARFGSQWVAESEVLQDDFYEKALARLRRAGMLENLPGNYRLKEI